jgi:hypothetical protein
MSARQSAMNGGHGAMIAFTNLRQSLDRGAATP